MREDAKTPLCHESLDDVLEILDSVRNGGDISDHDRIKINNAVIITKRVRRYIAKHFEVENV